ncbi:MAG: phytanoyl-CoA dioxygenase [Planctomycetota bacterium]|nr:MAG: phytanoyl-CoA dioxygenase [Planctomycetota bacterium]
MAMSTINQLEAFQESTHLLNDRQALQDRAHDQGYLYFKGLLNKEKILDLRKSILEIIKKHGWLEPCRTLMDGISKPGINVVEGSDNDYRHYYNDILSLRSFHALSHDPTIIALFEKLFGESVLVHSRNILRTIFPGITKHTTPPHQDYFYIGGTVDTWTSWIPCGDCPEELGGLAIIPGSHKRGLLDTRSAMGAGGHQVDVMENDLWCTNEVECGDVLLMNSMTIHQGRDNNTADRIRLSMDFRYQPISHPIREDSLTPHLVNSDEWEKYYENWSKEDDLKYYWKKMTLNIISR